MLGLSFPPFPLGFLACVALIPLLIVLEDIDGYFRALRYTYVAMFVFHAVTLNWTGGYSHGKDVYMMIAGAITILVHPLFFWLPIFGFMVIKRHLGSIASRFALPALWVAYEYTHSLSQWSFPWLTLGNSQTYELARIQFISFTGVYGLSLWILCINVLVYTLYSSSMSSGKVIASRKDAFLAVGLVILYLLPTVQGMLVLSKHPARPEGSHDSSSVTIGIVQSNLNPWDKWNMTGYQTQQMYLRLTERLVDSVVTRKPDIVLWPETAIPSYLIARRNSPVLQEFKSRIAHLGVAVLTGLPQAVLYPDSARAPASARILEESGERYEAFNAAAFFVPGRDSIPWYGKMKMVPIAERVPYADLFASFDFLRWGVGIGGWQIGPDTTIFQEPVTGAKFCTMICYESVYPSFVSTFVRKGAEFITIITIDSWWGKMSGAYQHSQFAVLRAVENRRWIARCALGGISSYIDPFGRQYEKTDLFTKALLAHDIERETELTPYTEHGDWLSELCLMVSGLLLAAAWGNAMYRNRQL